MNQNLTNDHRRLLGIAIAMAAADGTLDDREQALIDHLTEQLHLAPEAREEVAAMVEQPPSKNPSAGHGHRCGFPCANHNGPRPHAVVAYCGCRSFVVPG